MDYQAVKKRIDRRVEILTRLKDLTARINLADRAEFEQLVVETKALTLELHLLGQEAIAANEAVLKSLRA